MSDPIPELAHLSDTTDDLDAIIQQGPQADDDYCDITPNDSDEGGDADDESV